MLSSADAALVARDRALPGLVTVLDPVAFARVLGDLSPRFAQATVAPTYVRYKPGTRCLVAYDVGVAGGRLHVHANAYASPRWAERVAADQPDLRRAGTIVAPDQALVISIFPEDAALRLLTRLWDPTARRQLLQKLIPDHQSLHAADIDTLAYNPGRRYVGQLRGDGALAVLKLYADDVFGRARAAAATPQLTERLQTPVCIGRSRRHRVVVLEWLPGARLSDRLAAAPLDRAHLRQVGAALAELHRQLRYVAGGAPCVGATDMLATARSISALRADLGDRAQWLASTTARTVDARAPVQLIHGDFHAGQVLVGADRVGILDLDRSSAGDPVSDVGNFVAHLEYAAIEGGLPATARDIAADDFLTGYEEATRASVRDRIRPHVAAGLLRLAPRPFRTRAPEWADRMSAILDRVEVQIQDRQGVGPSPPPTEQDVVFDPFDTTRDRELGLAPDALEGASVARHLASLPMWRTTEALHVSAIRVVRHKPGRRCLIEYDVEVRSAHGDPERLTIIGKVNRKRADRHTLELTRAFRARGFDACGPGAISVPEPIGVLPDWKMWLQRKVTGTSADLLLGECDPEVLGRRAAEVVHALQGAKVTPRRSHTADDELGILRDRLSHVAVKRPLWRSRLDALVDRCGALLAALPSVESCGVHRDFHPGQLMMDGDGVHLLDLDLYAAGDPALDVGNFLAHIAEYSLRAFGDPRRLATCEAAMVHRFLELTPTLDRRRLDVYRLVSLTRHVHLSTRFPDRKAFTPRILQYCEEHLAVGSACAV